MLEVPRVTETSEYAHNNRPEYGLRGGGTEFNELLGHSGVLQTGLKEVTEQSGVTIDPDLMLPGGGIDIIAYDSAGNVRLIGRYMGRRVDVAI